MVDLSVLQKKVFQVDGLQVTVGVLLVVAVIVVLYTQMRK